MAERPDPPPPRSSPPSSDPLGILGSKGFWITVGVLVVLAVVGLVLLVGGDSVGRFTYDLF